MKLIKKLREESLSEWLDEDEAIFDEILIEAKDLEQHSAELEGRNQALVAHIDEFNKLVDMEGGEAIERLIELSSQSPQVSLIEVDSKQDYSLIDSIIEKLFRNRWSGNLSSAPVSEMRKQLQKTLQNQLDGYWSGHTAYHLSVDGGFMLNKKKNEKAKLTKLGEIFMSQQETR